MSQDLRKRLPELRKELGWDEAAIINLLVEAVILSGAEEPVLKYLEEAAASAF